MTILILGAAAVLLAAASSLCAAGLAVVVAAGMAPETGRTERHRDIRTW